METFCLEFRPKDVILLLSGLHSFNMVAFALLDGKRIHEGLTPTDEDGK